MNAKSFEALGKNIEKKRAYLEKLRVRQQAVKDKLEKLTSEIAVSEQIYQVLQASGAVSDSASDGSDCATGCADIEFESPENKKRKLDS